MDTSRQTKSLQKYSGVIGATVLVILLVVRFVQPAFIDMLDNKILDTFFRVRGIVEPGGQVVVVAIDEKSVAQKGRWPWSRVVLAQLIDSLVQNGCSVIGIDMIFPEPEPLLEESFATDLTASIIKGADGSASDETIIRHLNPLIGNMLPDTILAQSIKQADASVLGLFFADWGAQTSPVSGSSVKNTPTETLKEHRIIQVFEGEQPPPVTVFFTPQGYTATIPAIAQTVSGEGFLNVTPDPDGVIRRIPLIARYADAYYPSFSLELASAFTGEPIKLYLDEAGVESIQVGSSVPPVNPSGSMLVNYAGPQKTFPYFSAVDVMGRTVEDLDGKVALVGVTATGLYDIRVTPFEAVYPGVEIHANALDSMLNNRYLYNPWWTPLAVYLACIAAAVMLIMLIPRFSALLGSIATAVLITVIAGSSLILFLKVHIWFPPMYPLLVTGGVYLALTLIKFVREEHQRRFIKSAFGQYVSPQFVDQLVDRPELLTLGGQEQELTILFSDIVGFTSISERLSPARLVELLNKYTTEMSDIIMEHGGTIDKYNGDSVMAFFGAPISLPDHASRACAAAIRMIKRINELQDEWKRAGAPPFFSRIGINTGKVIVGNMGSRSKFNYTVLGDAVNLASRLEGANKFYRTQIIIGERTHRLIGRSFITRELDKVRVVGKKKPERIYQVVPHATRKYREFLKRYRKGRHLMRKGDWKGALNAFEHAQKIHMHDATTKLQIKRCNHLLRKPPEKNWDGSYELHSK